MEGSSALNSIPKFTAHRSKKGSFLDVLVCALAFEGQVDENFTCNRSRDADLRCANTRFPPQFLPHSFLIVSAVVILKG
jgi:hypothetical protein